MPEKPPCEEKYCETIRDCLEGDYSLWMLLWRHPDAAYVRPGIVSIDGDSDTITIWDGTESGPFYYFVLSTGERTAVSTNSINLNGGVGISNKSILGKYWAWIENVNGNPVLQIYKKNVLTQSIDLNVLLGWTSILDDYTVTLSYCGRYILVGNKGVEIALFRDDATDYSQCPVGEQCNETELDQTFSPPIYGFCFKKLQFLMTYEWMGGCSNDPYDGQADLTIYFDDDTTYTHSYYTHDPLIIDLLSILEILPKRISRIKIEPYTYGDGSVVTISNITCSGPLPPLPYNVTIESYCNSEGIELILPITKDGTPTGFDTPYTFEDLIGNHTFTVPDTDTTGHPFLKWSTEETNTTINVAAGGTYIAYYQIPAVGIGRLGFNVSKPYYYNGWYYVFYFVKVYPYTEYCTIKYARSQDLITWDVHDVADCRPGDFILDNSLFFGSMAVDNKVFIVDLDELTLESRTGTIGEDGLITFAAPVTIFTDDEYAGAVSGVRVTKIGENRKLFVIYCKESGGFDGDFLFISDNDGVSWTYKDYTTTFLGQNWGRYNYRIIPLNDGNKFIELISPSEWWYGPPIQEYWTQTIWAEYRHPIGFDTAIKLGDYYRYGHINLGDIPHGIMPSFVSSIDSGAEGCKLGSYIHVAYVDLDGNIQHKKAAVSTPSTWVDLDVVAVELTGNNLCASPVADTANDAVYIFYSDDHNIYYRRWTEGGGLETEVLFYTVPNPGSLNVIQNLTVYPDVIGDQIIIAWMQKSGGSSENWNVYCSSVTVVSP